MEEVIPLEVAQADDIILVSRAVMEGPDQTTTHGEDTLAEEMM